MTRKLDGALFEEPAVVIGCPDYRVGLEDWYSGAKDAARLCALYGGVVANGRWRGVMESSLVLPLDQFTNIVRYNHAVNGMALLKHLSKEECIAIFYRLPRNPSILMCAMRHPPKLFAEVWSFIQNEDTDAPAHILHDMGQDGLLLNGRCITSNAKVF